MMDRFASGFTSQYLLNFNFVTVSFVFFLV
jgi:hypothetical protein